MRTRSRDAPSRNSLSVTSTSGRSTSLPGRRRATGTPAQPTRCTAPLRVGQPGEGGIRLGLEAADAQRHFLAQRPAGGAQHHAALLAFAHRVGHEAEALDVADRMAFHHDLAAARHGRQQLVVLARVQPAHQHGGAAVDEAGGQPLVQGVRQPVLDLAGAALPVRARRGTQSARAAM